MKKKSWFIITPIIILLIGIGTLIIIKNITNSNNLTSEERTWINSNINNVQNVYVVKDENIVSKDGHGVFYDFLEDFKAEYGINVNVVSTNALSTQAGVNLNYTHEANNDNLVFLTDHYVILSKDKTTFNSNSDLEGLTIGILNEDRSVISTYLKGDNITLNGYDEIDELFTSLDSKEKYIILPRIKYLDEILTKNLNIAYHLSDINTYYYLSGNNDIFSSILEKYYHKWEDKNLNKYIKEEEFKIFTNSLNVSDKEVDKLLSVNYNYAFINNSPYEVIMSGNYGGIIAEYLQEFSKFSGIFFNVTKYSNENKLVDAINHNKVDLYFDFNTGINSNYLKSETGIISTMSIIAHYNNLKVINSVYGLQGETVYVEKGSVLENYLNSIGNINIKTYENNEELFKLNRENAIIVMDTYIYNYYHNSRLNNYVSRYEDYLNNEYYFRIKSGNETLKTLLDRYINYLDPHTVINNGITSHMKTVSHGSILNNIAIYFILSIILVLVSGFIVYHNSKKIRIARRLKKDDKIRFIDELTCLKNRAYLSDFMKTWSNNTIYPQTIIVVDLNRLQEINDKYGVSEGDKQIQAAANALIKTQLDNSELMRSDGNEFVIYTVGYSQKQIINYIHKLNKELGKLPYNFGAEFGYSMILNNLKTIEDALTEATMDMKNKKVSGK